MNSTDYTAARQQVSVGLLSAARQHDTAILILSAGALVLSLILELAPSALLGWSWVCLVLAIFITLFSFQASILCFERLGENLDVVYSGQTDRTKLSNSWRTLTFILGPISLICFIVGMSLLVVCAYQCLEISASIAQ